MASILRTYSAWLWLGLALAIFAGPPLPAHAASTTKDTGVLLVVPDRGWLGNEEIRDAWAPFAKARNARILFMADERSEVVLDAQLKALRAAGARQFVVLPLVLSASDPRWQQAQGWLQSRHQAGERWATAPVYGQSYLAVEDLSARLRQAHGEAKQLLLLGYGAKDAAQAKTMAADLERIAGFASSLKPEAIHAVVHPGSWALKDLRAKVDAAVKNAHDTVVVPVALAPRDDSMMDFTHWFNRKLPKDAQMLTSPLATTEALSQWLHRATARARLQLDPVDGKDIGVVVLAHGADWFWNRDIRQALAPVAAKHKLAFAFSMADQPVVQRAIDQLEAEHVRAIVVVRAFSMASSFLPATRRMLGLDVEDAAHSPAPKTGHHGMMMMGHHGGQHATIAAAPRIRADVPVVTVGGVQDAALYAKALLHNARSVSTDPARETVILVAHGQGADQPNQRWIKLLSSLAGQMRADGGDAFRDIQHATWREDWPEKRKKAVAHVREMVKQAQQDNGRALIVPARINRQGRADDYLKGLQFGWSQGFAQTPYFAQWFEQEIDLGLRELNAPQH